MSSIRLRLSFGVCSIQRAMRNASPWRSIRGEDTDTVGAIAGGLAGLAYGYDAIPASWLDALLKKEELEAACRAFYPMVQGKQKRDSGEKILYAVKALEAAEKGTIDERAIVSLIDHIYNGYYPCDICDEKIEQCIAHGSEKQCCAMFVSLWREDHWIGYTFEKRIQKGQVQRLLERLLTLWRGSGKGNSVIA